MEVKQWCASIDWLTCTYKSSNDEVNIPVASGLEALYVSLFGSGAKTWNDKRTGYLGRATADYFVGRRKTGVMLVCSGYKADVVARVIPDPSNVSRIDFALTIWYAEDPGDTIKPLADCAAVYRDGLELPTPYGVTLYNGYGKGDTLYIGAGASDKYFRLYDKWRESKLDMQFLHSLRYEVEYKGRTAYKVWKEGRKEGFTQSVISDTVQQYCIERGITICDLLMTDRAVDSRVQRDKSNDERRLNWLNKSVAPAVADLLMRQSIGDVLKALELEDRVNPT